MRPPFRSLALGAGALLLTASMAACGSSGSTKSTSPSGSGGKTVACPLPALAKATGPVKMSFWYGGLVGEAKITMMQMVAGYNKSQSKVIVTASDQGKDYQTSLNKYTAAIPTKGIPNSVYVENNQARFMVDSGTIIPGQACAAEGVISTKTLVPSVRSYYTIDGAYQPAAVNVSGLQLYYNKKQFEQAGLDPNKAPGTIAELRTDAVKLKAAGVESPISMKIDPWFFEVWLGGIGQSMVNEANGHDGVATKAVFDTPEATSLMTELKSMYDDGLIAKISNTPGQQNHYINVATGKSAILMETSTAATTIEAFLGGKLSASDLGIDSAAAQNPDVKIVPGFAPVPGIDKPGQAEINGAAMYVTTAGTAAQQGAAMDFMRYINQVPQQVTWHVQGSYLPSDTRVAASPKVQAFWKTSIAGASLKIATEQLKAVNPSRSGPIIGPYDQYKKIIQSMMESVFLKNSAVAPALAKAQTDVTAALKSYAQANGN